MKYAYEVSRGCAQYMWSYVEVGSKCQYCNLGCIFHQFSFIFFADCNLFRLQNMPTKFCEAVLSICGVMLKLGQNAILQFMVRADYDPLRQQ